MSDVRPAEDTDGSVAAPAPDVRIAIEKVHPNPEQPRRSFDTEALDDLAASVREHGIIQPLIVRPSSREPGNYEIVAGERRWRAAQIAQLHEVPILVRDFNDQEVLEVAIIENVQRADLNPIEEAAGYRQLMDRFGHTQDELSRALGKSRSHIANQVRLLSLPEDVQSYLVDGRLSAGHARTLVGHPAAGDLARDIIRRGLSVRAAEKLAKSDPSKPKPSKNAATPKDPDTVQIERELAATLNMAVNIDHKQGAESGSLTLRYKSLAQLDDLLRVLSGG